MDKIYLQAEATPEEVDSLISLAEKYGIKHTSGRRSFTGIPNVGMTVRLAIRIAAYASRTAIHIPARVIAED